MQAVEAPLPVAPTTASVGSGGWADRPVGGGIPCRPPRCTDGQALGGPIGARMYISWDSTSTAVSFANSGSCIRAAIAAMSTFLSITMAVLSFTFA